LILVVNDFCTQTFGNFFCFVWDKIPPSDADNKLR